MEELAFSTKYKISWLLDLSNPVKSKTIVGFNAAQFAHWKAGEKKRRKLNKETKKKQKKGGPGVGKKVWTGSLELEAN